MPRNILGWTMACAMAAAIAAPTQAATLLHSYSFGTDASDGTGSMNGSILGNATVSGNVLNLPSDASYVELSGFAIPASDYSISVWAKGGPQATGQHTEFVSQNQGGGNGIYIGTNPAGHIRLGDQILDSGIAFPADDQFHNYVFATDGTGSKFYLDGTLVGTYGALVAQPQVGTNTRFGRQFGGNAEQFIGQLDDIFIYSGAVTAQEAAALASSRSVDPVNELPEPVSMLLLGTGLAGIAVVRRRR